MSAAEFRAALAEAEAPARYEEVYVGQYPSAAAAETAHANPIMMVRFPDCLLGGQ